MARSKPPKQSFSKDSKNVSSTSAVLLSSFHPSLPLFASGMLSLDAWHIRIADPTTSSIRNEYALDKGIVCRCLSWGTSLQTKKSEKSKKKRKVEDSTQDGILAAGTNDGSIYLFAPAESETIGRLQGGHTGEVLALSFNQSSLWSAGSDGKVCEWELSTHKVLQSISVDSANALNAIALRGSDLLAASYSIRHLALPNTDPQNTYTNHTSPIHSLLYGPDNQFISAAEDDRYMNVFTLGKPVQERTLVAEANVRRLTLQNDTLCAVTIDGTVEIYSEVFAASATSSNKRRKSQVASAKSVVSVVRPDSAAVSITDASLRADHSLILAWNEGARMVFETIKIRNEDGGSLIDTMKLVRAALPALGATNGTKEKSRTAYHDGNAQIVAGNDLQDLEMTDANVVNGHVSDASTDEESPATEEPTLAERLHAMEVGAVTPARPQTSSKSAVLKMPSASSLATILTQALKSSDTALLESCLHHSDSKVILTTIRRLDATLAVNLLEQLASRISRRPGRSGDLGVWVRWTIVVHGGYLASLPNLVKTLSSLHSVLSTRAAALPRLLALQGRLDMVSAQIELRREGGLRATSGEDPSDVEYIEGESDLSDEEIGIEDASQLGGVETSDEDSEAGSESDDEGDFSEDSGDGNEFAELDAQMEMMQDDDEEGDDDEEEEEVEGASDDEAAAA